jgi:hypothetical protein
MLDYWPWIAIGVGLVALLFASRRSRAPIWIGLREGSTRSGGGEHGFHVRGPRDHELEHQAQASPRRLDSSGVMQMVISTLVLLSALFIILSGRYGDAEQKWAFGVIGTVIGFWFKK